MVKCGGRQGSQISPHGWKNADQAKNGGSCCLQKQKMKDGSLAKNIFVTTVVKAPDGSQTGKNDCNGEVDQFPSPFSMKFRVAATPRP